MRAIIFKSCLHLSHDLRAQTEMMHVVECCSYFIQGFMRRMIVSALSSGVLFSRIYHTVPDPTCLSCGLFVCFYCCRQRKEHSHHNPSYYSQSGARPHDSHSRGGVNAERQPSSSPRRRQRHDTDSSDGGSPAPRKGVSYKTAPAGDRQSHRRRHDTDSDD